MILIINPSPKVPAAVIEMYSIKKHQHYRLAISRYFVISY